MSGGCRLYVVCGDTMLFVYVAFMGGLVQFCWVFLVDILSSSHSLGDFDTQCRAIFQRYVNLYINCVQDYILSRDCLFRVTHAAAANGACQESMAITGLPGRCPAVALLWKKFELFFFFFRNAVIISFPGFSSLTVFP